MKYYHYLAAGLPELSPDQTGKPLDTAEFLKTCAELLAPADYRRLRKLFFWNDMRNLLFYSKPGDPFCAPAYYEEPEFADLLREGGETLPFLERILRNRENGTRDFPGLSDIDEVAAQFFGGLEKLNDRFLEEYYSFELELRNLLTLLSLGKLGKSIENKLVPFGRVYEAVREKGWPAEEVFQEFPFARGLGETFGRGDAVASEREIDAVRWAWLEQYPCDGENVFSADAVLVYNLKLGILNRWAGLEAGQGRKLFEDLVGIIRRSIRFSIEFATAGENKK